nr:hypothetical protein [Desulfobacula sp.]
LPVYEEPESPVQGYHQQRLSPGSVCQTVSLYLDNIIKRIELQEAAYAKEKGLPPQLPEILAGQKQALLALKKAHGSIVHPDVFAG